MQHGGWGKWRMDLRGTPPRARIQGRIPVVSHIPELSSKGMGVCQPKTLYEGTCGSYYLLDALFSVIKLLTLFMNLHWSSPKQPELVLLYLSPLWWTLGRNKEDQSSKLGSLIDFLWAPAKQWMCLHLSFLINDLEIKYYICFLSYTHNTHILSIKKLLMEKCFKLKKYVCRVNAFVLFNCYRASP